TRPWAPCEWISPFLCNAARERAWPDPTMRSKSTLDSGRPSDAPAGKNCDMDGRRAARPDRSVDRHVPDHRKHGQRTFAHRADDRATDTWAGAAEWHPRYLPREVGSRSVGAAGHARAMVMGRQPLTAVVARRLARTSCEGEFASRE